MSHCILWQKATITTQWGLVYGMGYIDGKVTTAHRVVWMKANGPIPQGYEVHHTCEVTLCVNLDHLELVTRAEHAKRHPRLSCKRGHLLTGDNAKPNGTGRNGKPKITCRTCAKERNRRYKFRPDKPAHDCDWTEA